jgi:hypothetical protein
VAFKIDQTVMYIKSVCHRDKAYAGCSSPHRADKTQDRTKSRLSNTGSGHDCSVDIHGTSDSSP